MERETNKERTSRIMKELMFNLKFQSITDFANKINAQYMQAYYAYSGTVNNLSQELIDRILESFPNVSEKFLRKGEYPIFVNDTSFIDNEQKPSQNPVSTYDMFAMLERVASMFEKLQQCELTLRSREDALRARENHIIELEKKLADALERIGN